MQQINVNWFLFNHVNEQRLVKFILFVELLFYLNFIVVTAVGDGIIILANHNFDFNEFIEMVFYFWLMYHY